MPSLRPYFTVLRLPLALALALVALLVAAAAGRSRGLTPTAASARGAGESDAPSPTPSLALRPGARLAPERILDFSSTPLALDYDVTDQDARPPTTALLGRRPRAHQATAAPSNPAPPPPRLPHLRSPAAPPR
ncbi:hypothetical protein [Streptomyces justiciae]|uniref:hypothetical protein n=1 Tax=Streptomyces justiciae TaxID=2780140 RepID=UPI002117BDFA|nr:hypothetical protein [Streptomyces justiciae]MCW8384530.1 hypothetical protein [Streptomyces justiciae]